MDQLIQTVGLGDQADQKIASLSGGQRRRLDAAIGIIGRPELLFLDEPTAGFDPHARRDFHDLVHRPAVEIAASWRHLETVAVLGVWTLVGLVLAPVVLRRMARKESGSSMDARRQRALQRIG